MFARIIVTGLILDPETSSRQYWFGTNGVVSNLEARLSKRHATTRLSKSHESRRAAWRSQHQHKGISSDPVKSANIGGLVLEAPFQQAVAKQHSLSAAGRPYLRHSWHRIDMLAVVCYWVTFILAITGQEATAERHTYIFRSLSVLRAGRLLVITSGTTTILHSLKRAGPMLITVAFYVVFAVILFSIIGVQSFRGSFRRSCVLTDPNNSTNQVVLEQLCGGHINLTTLLNDNYLEEDGTRSDAPPKGYICPVGQVCHVQAENPEGNAMSFDNIFYSLLQVTIIASSMSSLANMATLAIQADALHSQQLVRWHVQRDGIRLLRILPLLSGGRHHYQFLDHQFGRRSRREHIQGYPSEHETECIRCRAVCALPHTIPQEAP